MPKAQVTATGGTNITITRNSRIELGRVIKKKYLEVERPEDPGAGFEVSTVLQPNASPSYNLQEGNILSSDVQCLR